VIIGLSVLSLLALLNHLELQQCYFMDYLLVIIVSLEYTRQEATKLDEIHFSLGLALTRISLAEFSSDL